MSFKTWILYLRITYNLIIFFSDNITKFTKEFVPQVLANPRFYLVFVNIVIRQSSVNVFTILGDEMVKSTNFLVRAGM